MDTSFDPVNQLKTLLGSKPSHPWGALIPQVLLWCFRRFCIQTLIETSEVSLSEQIWDDYLDLIHTHAPKGLESASSSWFTPENIDHVSSSLEEFNRFFMEILVIIDTAVTDSDSELENSISAFLDVEIKEVVKDWLEGEYSAFIIFPMDDEYDDEFTDEQFSNLLNALMKFSGINIPVEEPIKEPVEEPIKEPVPWYLKPNPDGTPFMFPFQYPLIITTPPPEFRPPPSLFDSQSNLYGPLSASVEAPPGPSIAQYTPPLHLYVQQDLPPTTIKMSIAHCKTRRNRLVSTNCGKTRRIHNSTINKEK